jgi:hypothetical protein
LAEGYMLFDPNNALVSSSFPKFNYSTSVRVFIELLRPLRWSSINLHASDSDPARMGSSLPSHFGSELRN